ncbi:MAG: HAMP domain-containing histidine kinase [Gammaproteobacteria bacterium]|nr:HAMP domain-containing histidine kinase [Gammaproteobacteria bacterium]
MFSPLSLGVQLVMLALLSFSLFALVVVRSSEQAFGDALVNTVQADVARTSRMLNLALSAAVATGDLATVSLFFNEMLTDRDVAHLDYILLLDEHQQPMLGAGTVPQPLPLVDEALEPAVRRGLVNAGQPILLFDNNVGSLRFGLSTVNLQQANSSAQRQAIWATLIGLALVSALLLWFGVALSRRIRGLVRASLQLVEGNLAFRAPIGRRDELGRLAHHFNLMAAAIAERIHQAEHARTELELLNATLEQRVSSRTAELQQRNQELSDTLSRLESARQQLVEREKLASLGALVTGVAHELNTPLGNALLASSALMGEVEQLASSIDTGLRRTTLDQFIAHAREATAISQRNLERAAALINSFKSIAVDQTSEQRRHFDLASVVADVVCTLQPSLRRAHCQLQLEVAEGLVMDSYPGAISQIITNVLSNAMVHAFPGRDQGSIALTVTASSPASLTLSFIDDGVGMSDEVRRRIFEPFFTTRMGQGGSGLGMHLVYNLTTGLLGGSVAVHAQPGGGTCVVATLPRVAPPREEP